MIGVVLLIVGLILIYNGYQAQQSLGSQVSEALTGTMTDKALWLLVGGIASTLIGIILLGKK